MKKKEIGNKVKAQILMHLKILNQVLIQKATRKNKSIKERKKLTRKKSRLNNQLKNQKNLLRNLKSQIKRKIKNLKNLKKLLLNQRTVIKVKRAIKILLALLLKLNRKLLVRQLLRLHQRKCMLLKTLRSLKSKRRLQKRIQ
jgi:hypothetical protein